MSEQLTAIRHRPSGKAFGTDRQAQGQGARIAIVAAMEREVAPLIRGWKVREVACDGRRYRLFESGDTVLICGGIGAEAARRAAEAVIRDVEPVRVISVGFSGALNSTMKVADVLEPRVVVNSTDGSRTDTGAGRGTLVSYSGVADRNQKQRLAQAYAADAVDMEAAAVAQAAQAHEIEFAAVKVISDAADFAMPPTEKFVSSSGEFRTVGFVLHAAVRPWLWGSTISLARNSARASRALSAATESYLERESANLRSRVSPMNAPKQSLGEAPSAPSVSRSQ
ncbi:MAG: hypothetical protein WAU58_18375 [Terriglobales bacterium]